MTRKTSPKAGAKSAAGATPAGRAKSTEAAPTAGATQRGGAEPGSLVALARRWLSCFDTKDVDQLVSLYAEDARHFSPKLRMLRPATGGCIQGRAALREWWADAFRRLPQLRYLEQGVTAQEGHVVLEYLRLVPGEPDLPVAEAFEVRDGLIQESRVYHG